MSAINMQATVIATKIVKALEADRDPGYDLEAGMFGPALSAFIRELAESTVAVQRNSECDLLRAQRDAAYAALDAVLEFAQQWGEWTVGKQLEELLLKHGIHARERCAFCGVHVESPCESAPVDTCEKALNARMRSAMLPLPVLASDEVLSIIGGYPWAHQGNVNKDAVLARYAALRRLALKENSNGR